jgi:hypothetical protein
MVQHYVYEAHDTILKRAKEVILTLSKGKEQQQLLEVLHKNCAYQNPPDLIQLKTQIANRFIEENAYFI